MHYKTSRGLRFLNDYVFDIFQKSCFVSIKDEQIEDNFEEKGYVLLLVVVDIKNDDRTKESLRLSCYFFQNSPNTFIVPTNLFSFYLL